MIKIACITFKYQNHLNACTKFSSIRFNSNLQMSNFNLNVVYIYVQLFECITNYKIQFISIQFQLIQMFTVLETGGHKKNVHIGKTVEIVGQNIQQRNLSV